MLTATTCNRVCKVQLVIDISKTGTNLHKASKRAIIYTILLLNEIPKCQQDGNTARVGHVPLFRSPPPRWTPQIKFVFSAIVHYSI